MAIRKLTYAPSDVRAPPPRGEIKKNGIKLDASLGKEVTAIPPFMVNVIIQSPFSLLPYLNVIIGTGSSEPGSVWFIFFSDVLNAVQVREDGHLELYISNT